MKDRIYWSLALIGFSLMALGLAIIFLELRLSGPYGSPTMLFGLIPFFAGMASLVVADKRGKRP